jgi:hypothetical protein
VTRIRHIARRAGHGARATLALLVAQGNTVVFVVGLVTLYAGIAACFSRGSANIVLGIVLMLIAIAPALVRRQGND